MRFALERLQRHPFVDFAKDKIHHSQAEQSRVWGRKEWVVVYKLCIEYATQLGDFLKTKAFSSHTILNYDDTRIVANSSSSWGPNGWFHATKQNHNINLQSPNPIVPHTSPFWLQMARWSHHTLSFVQISTPTTLPRHPSLWKGEIRDLRGESSCRLFQTETGYVNDEVFKKICEDFFIRWEQLHPGLSCLVLGTICSLIANLPF